MAIAFNATGGEKGKKKINMLYFPILFMEIASRESMCPCLRARGQFEFNVFKYPYQSLRPPLMPLRMFSALAELPVEQRAARLSTRCLTADRLYYTPGSAEQHQSWPQRQTMGRFFKRSQTARGKITGTGFTWTSNLTFVSFIGHEATFLSKGFC